MTRDEFNNYYKKEIQSFTTNLTDEKTRVKTLLHDKFRDQGYSEVIEHREAELKKKV
jgi:hypothetical protein